MSAVYPCRSHFSGVAARLALSNSKAVRIVLMLSRNLALRLNAIFLEMNSYRTCQLCAQQLVFGQAGEVVRERIEGEIPSM